MSQRSHLSVSACQNGQGRRRREWQAATLSAEPKGSSAAPKKYGLSGSKRCAINLFSVDPGTMSIVSMAKLGVYLKTSSDSDDGRNGTRRQECNMFTQIDVSELVQKRAVPDVVNFVYNVGSGGVPTAALSICRNVLPMMREDKSSIRVAYRIALAMGYEVNSVAYPLFHP